MSPSRRPHVTNDAPVGSVDLNAHDEDGNPYQIWPCLDCYPWHAEVVREGEDLVVREWHAIECPQLVGLIGDPEVGEH
jgi:hypothetical protein